MMLFAQRYCSGKLRSAGRRKIREVSKLRRSAEEENKFDRIATKVFVSRRVRDIEFTITKKCLNISDR